MASQMRDEILVVCVDCFVQRSHFIALDSIFSGAKCAVLYHC